MARSVNLIKQQIMDNVYANTEVNSTSAVSITNLLAYIFAAYNAYQEQLNDQFVQTIENLENSIPAANLLWIQKKAFEFQYSLTNPQVIKFDTANILPYYESVNPNYQIITNCSVTELDTYQVNIKVAKGSTGSFAQPLNPYELSAFKFYCNQIKPAGLKYNCISVPSDRLFCKCTVYYSGIYSATIANSLYTAYKQYLNNIPFGGGIKYVDLVIALRSVTGVDDLVIEELKARPYTSDWGDSVTIVSDRTVIYYPEYITVSGYISEDDEPGADFINNLTLLTI